MKHISQSTLDFLSELKENNDREWFSQNRFRYNKAKEDFGAFIQGVIDEVIRFDPILKGLEAKTCIFRINRDIRFSNDKTIYKTHLGAFIARGGKRNGDRFAGYYIHVEPGGNTMIAGGAYMPPMPWLSAIREKIAGEGDDFIEIINDKELREYFGGLEGESLKGAPRGFPKDHPYIELLKMKSYLVSRIFPDKEVTKDDFLKTVVRGCMIMKPLNDFLNDYDQY